MPVGMSNTFDPDRLGLPPPFTINKPDPLLLTAAHAPVDVKPEGQSITGCEEVVLAAETACPVHMVPAAVSFAVTLATFTVPDGAGTAVRTPEPASQLSTVIEDGGSDSPPVISESLSVWVDGCNSAPLSLLSLISLGAICTICTSPAGAFLPEKVRGSSAVRLRLKTTSETLPPSVKANDCSSCDCTTSPPST